MARLPVLGGDDDQWGAVNNEFLSVAHNADGTLKGGGGGVTGFYDITTYGAVTGTVDNQAAIDSAITAAAATGGVVYCPPGQWTTTGGHQIPLNVSIRGAGKGVTLINFTGVGTYCFFIGSTTAGPNAPSYMGKVSDFSLQGQSAGDGTGPFGHQIGISVLNCLFFNLQDIHCLLLWKAFLIDGGDEVALGAGTFAGNGYCTNLTSSNVFIGFHVSRWVTDTYYGFLYCYGNSPKAAGSIGLWIDNKASTSTFVNFSTEGIDTGISIGPINQGICFVNPRLEDCNSYVTFTGGPWGVIVVGGEEFKTGGGHIDWPTAGTVSGGGANTIISRNGWFQDAPASGLPTAAAATRYGVYKVRAPAGSADGVYVCTKDAANNYAWHEITGTGGGAAAVATGIPGPLDQGLKGWAYDPVALGSSGSPPVSGRLQLIRVAIPQAGTVTGVAVELTGAAAAPTGTYFGLYDPSGNRVAVTADVSTSTTSAGPKQFAFTTPYAVTTPGVYYVGVLQTATTPMGIARPGLGGSASYVAGTSTAPFRWGAGASGLSTLPATVTLATTTATTDAFWVALY